MLGVAEGVRLTRVLFILMLLIGIVLIVCMIMFGGGVLVVGIIFGVLFMVVGVVCFYLEFWK